MKNGYFIGKINPTFPDKPDVTESRFDLRFVVFMDADLINGLVSGKILTGKPHMNNGKIDGFRWRFSKQNQSIDNSK